MISNIKKIIYLIALKLGYVFVKREKLNAYKRYFRQQIRHHNLIKNLDFENIIDVGAHVGGFAEETFSAGFSGNMYSFEPVKNSFNDLKEKSLNKENWYVYNYAIGDKQELIEMKVSDNYVSSSILKINESHVKSAPDSVVIRTELVSVRTLKEVVKELGINLQNTLVKIDTQGFEMKVLLGLEEKLTEIKAIKLEMSLIELYEESPLFYEVSEFLYKNGFVLHSVENGFYDENSFELLQLDGLFINKLI